MKTHRFAIIGTGFWARFQLAGWLELPGVECVALYNRTRSKAEALAAEFGIANVYDDAGKMLDKESIDFVDIITGEGTHEAFTRMAAQRKIPVVCQKPFAPNLESARRMLAVCREAGVPLLINENFRWQSGMRALKEMIDSGIIGEPWRARIVFNSSFPVFRNQPFLRELDRFLLMDVGVHLVDCARFLFGDIASLYCRTHKIHEDIKGEDAVSLLMGMENGMTVAVEISYASRWSGDCFPETLCFVEGRDASAELLSGFRARVTTKDGTQERVACPPSYPWADPEYAAVHASIVDCQRNLLKGLAEDEFHAETRAEDNIKTFEAVWRAYDSARDNAVVSVGW